MHLMHWATLSCGATVDRFSVVVVVRCAMCMARSMWRYHDARSTAHSTQNCNCAHNSILSQFISCYSRCAHQSTDKKKRGSRVCHLIWTIAHRHRRDFCSIDKVHTERWTVQRETVNCCPQLKGIDGILSAPSIATTAVRCLSASNQSDNRPQKLKMQFMVFANTKQQTNEYLEMHLTMCAREAADRGGHASLRVWSPGMIFFMEMGWSAAFFCAFCAPAECIKRRGYIVIAAIRIVHNRNERTRK